MLLKCVIYLSDEESQKDNIRHPQGSGFNQCAGEPWARTKGFTLAGSEVNIFGTPYFSGKLQKEEAGIVPAARTKHSKGAQRIVVLVGA